MDLSAKSAEKFCCTVIFTLSLNTTPPMQFEITKLTAPTPLFVVENDGVHLDPTKPIFSDENLKRIKDFLEDFFARTGRTTLFKLPVLKQIIKEFPYQQLDLEKALPRDVKALRISTTSNILLDAGANFVLYKKRMAEQALKNKRKAKKNKAKNAASFAEPKMPVQTKDSEPGQSDNINCGGAITLLVVTTESNPPELGQIDNVNSVEVTTTEDTKEGEEPHEPNSGTTNHEKVDTVPTEAPATTQATEKVATVQGSTAPQTSPSVQPMPLGATKNSAITNANLAKPSEMEMYDLLKTLNDKLDKVSLENQTSITKNKTLEDKLDKVLLENQTLKDKLEEVLLDQKNIAEALQTMGSDHVEAIAIRAIFENLRNEMLQDAHIVHSGQNKYVLMKENGEMLQTKYSLAPEEFALLCSPYKEGNTQAHKIRSEELARRALHNFDNHDLQPKVADEKKAGPTTAAKIYTALYKKPYIPYI